MSDGLIIHDLQQGSEEWKAHRRLFDNASDAPVMMGASPHRKRLELLTQYQTGQGPEHSDYVEEVVFPAGHEAEALCRELAERVLGEELAPMVATRGRRSASYDGVNMDMDTFWEHKQLNDELRACMVSGCTGRDLPLYHRIQLEQECLVLGVKRGLFSASEWANGKLVEHRHCWYESDQDLAKRIEAGWVQFHVDVANHVPVVEPVKPEAAAIKALPALILQIRGEVVSQNLDVFKEAAEQFIANIRTDLNTDQDFADAASTVGFCEDAEKRLEMVKAQAQAQAKSIDEVFQAIDHIKALLRAKRLDLDKKVEARKASIRAEVIAEHQALLDAHVKHLNESLGQQWIQREVADFQGAIKGKRTIVSLREAAGVLLTQRKLALNEVRDTLQANRAALVDDDKKDWFFLFADFATLGKKPREDFLLLARARVQTHKNVEAEERRKAEERQRVEAERAAEAERARQAAAAAPPPPAPASAPALPPAPPPLELSASMLAPAQLPPAGERATLNLSAIKERFGPGFNVTGDWLANTLGVKHRESPRSSLMYYPSDFKRICDALMKHIQTIRDLPF